jgi:DNA-binding NarL/FixJ family response regulator
VGNSPERGRGESLRSPRLMITRRQAAILDLLAGGVSNAGIAERLMVSKRCVQLNLSRLLSKLHVPDRITLALYWSYPLFRIGVGYESPTPHPPAGR